jgi:hypothetical protein
MAAIDRPRIEYRTPVDLVADVRRGAIRIPGFQRGFRWEAGDVVRLFDSLVRGYPVGNLLFWRQPAPARRLVVGAIDIDAAELDSADWVVDGQQRIVSMVSALTSAHTATDARFRVHLDLVSGEFHTAGPRQQVPATWLPISLLVNTSTLLRWFRENHEWINDEQISVAEHAAKAVREYQIPTYVVASPDEAELVNIFARMNTTGKPLTKTEVFQALHSAMSGDEPADLHSLARLTATMGFGALDERLALRCVLAYRGGDIFREEFQAEFDSVEDRLATFRDVGAILRDVVTFLAREAGIPHNRLLPYSHVVPVLVRFVRLHGTPEGRVATLLRRWVWRGAIAGTRARGVSVPAIRDQLASLDIGDPLDAAQALLSAIPSFPDFQPELDKVHFNHAIAKINVLGMLSARPREFGGGDFIDISSVLQKGSPLHTIINAEVVGTGTLANRLIADAGSGRTLRQALLTAPGDVAASHLVDADCLAALRNERWQEFLVYRATLVLGVLRVHVRRMCEWGARDGRAISDIMRAA